MFIRVIEKTLYGFGFGTGMGLSFFILPQDYRKKFDNINNNENSKENKK